MVPGFHMQPISSAGDIIVNLTITVNVKHDYKLLTVVGPKRPSMQSFLRYFEQNLGSVSHFWVSRFSDSVRRDFKLSFQEEAGSSSPIIQSIAETGNQSFKSEEAAYYYFYKILSNRTYSLGQELGKFISDFQGSFPLKQHITEGGDLSPSDLSDERASVLSSVTRDSLAELGAYELPNWSPEESTKIIVKEIDNTVSKFDSNYLSLRNPSSTLVDDLLPRLRPSVERYIFEGLGRTLWLHYRKFYLEDDKSYSMKSIAIRGAHGATLAEACGIRKEFRFRFDRSIALMNDLQRSFDSSAVIIPNTFVQRLLSILVSVKTEVLTGTLGQKELESMDDIAPIFLFILISASEIKSPNALYHLLQDTMRPDHRLETEGRTVALLEGATRLVINDWSLPQDDAANLLVDL